MYLNYAINLIKLSTYSAYSNHHKCKISIMNKYSEEFYSWIKVLNSVVETRDAYTQGHSVRVAYYAQRIGEKLGLSTDELDDLHIAGLLHDIGKVGIPDSILHKPGKLDYEERAMIQMHSEISSQLLKDGVHLESILPMIRHHHEQMDGSGYPDGLKGEDIPFGARILTIADIFDALTSKRVYRDAMDYDKAISIIQEFIDEGKLDTTITPAAFEVFAEGVYEIVENVNFQELEDKRNTFFYTDKLTSLYNRDALLMLLKKASYNDCVASMIEIDIVHFKNYNKKHGTYKGDELLQEISQELKKLQTSTKDKLLPHEKMIYPFRLDSDHFYLLYLGYGYDFFEHKIITLEHQLEKIFDVDFKMRTLFENKKIPKNIEIEMAYLI